MTRRYLIASECFSTFLPSAPNADVVSRRVRAGLSNSLFLTAICHYSADTLPRILGSCNVCMTRALICGASRFRALYSRSTVEADLTPELARSLSGLRHFQYCTITPCQPPPPVYHRYHSNRDGPLHV